jgi:hypothetical protein
VPIFMLARDGKLIAEDDSKVTFEELGRYTDIETGKPVANLTRCTYTEADERYVVTFTRHSDLSTTKFIDDLEGPKKGAAKLVGFDGAYLRIAGELRIERYQGEKAGGQPRRRRAVGADVLRQNPPLTQDCG